MTVINVEGTQISATVAQMIICMATSEVEGIASVAGMGLATGIKNLFSSDKENPGIELETGEDGGLFIGVHVEVFYGYVLPEIAAKVRTAVANAVETQLGAKVDAIDIYVDGIKFAE